VGRRNDDNVDIGIVGNLYPGIADPAVGGPGSQLVGGVAIAIADGNQAGTAVRDDRFRPLGTCSARTDQANTHHCSIPLGCGFELISVGAR
jgi:hypothetical protein